MRFATISWVSLNNFRTFEKIFKFLDRSVIHWKTFWKFCVSIQDDYSTLNPLANLDKARQSKLSFFAPKPLNDLTTFSCR